MKYNSDEIKEIIPHRYPFLLVDKIIDGESGKWAEGIKYISANDQVFLGHFPKKNVYPGVLIVESMAQVGAVAILSQEENRGKIAYFTGIKNAKFKRQVLPGSELVIRTELTYRKFNIGFAKAEARVNNEIVCSCEISFAIS